jgi:phosphohistidine swiveling domain-containing protein
MGDNKANSRSSSISEKYIAKSTAIAARLLGGEMMIMSAADSTFFTLNEVATAIWQAADGHTSLADIVTRTICPRFEVDPAQAEADAEQFVTDLATHGILILSEQPITGRQSGDVQGQR